MMPAEVAPAASSAEEASWEGLAPEAREVSVVEKVAGSWPR